MKRVILGIVFQPTFPHSVMKRSVLNQLYDRAIRGLPVAGTPQEMAAARRKSGEPVHVTAEKLTGFYTGLCGATGFACGLPGYFAMPLAVPSNLAGVAMLQLHLCATVAHLAGRDIEDPAVRRQCVACIVAQSEDDPDPDESRGVVMRVATKVAERGVRFAGEKALSVFRRSGARSLPLLGGFVGGYSDVQSTLLVSRRARQVFHPLGEAAE